MFFLDGKNTNKAKSEFFKMRKSAELKGYSLWFLWLIFKKRVIGVNNSAMKMESYFSWMQNE